MRPLTAFCLALWGLGGDRVAVPSGEDRTVWVWSLPR